MAALDFVISFIDATEATLTFKVKEFSKLNGPKFSPPCYLLNVPWKILIMPRATRDETGKLGERYLSYYVQCNEQSKSKSWSCHIKAELSLLSAKAEFEPLKKRIEHSFNSKQNNFGLASFIPWNYILDPANGYIENDTITLELHIITEEPKNMGIQFEWNDQQGCITVPRNKWCKVEESLESNDSILEEERSSMIASDDGDNDEDNDESLSEENIDSLPEESADLEKRSEDYAKILRLIGRIEEEGEEDDDENNFNEDYPNIRKRIEIEEMVDEL